MLPFVVTVVIRKVTTVSDDARRHCRGNSGAQDAISGSRNYFDHYVSIMGVNDATAGCTCKSSLLPRTDIHGLNHKSAY